MAAKCGFALLFLELFFAILIHCQANTLSLSQHDLMRKMLKYHEPNVMPDPKYSEDGKAIEFLVDASVEVHSAMVLEKNLQVEIVVSLRWSDERLEFPPNVKMESNIRLPKDFQVWTPELRFQHQSFRSEEKLLFINKNGSMRVTERFSGEFICAWEPLHYPFEHRNCTLILETLDSIPLSCFRGNCGDNISLISDQYFVRIDIRKISKRQGSQILLTAFVMTSSMTYLLLTVYLPSFCILILIWVAGFATRRTVRAIFCATSFFSLIFMWYWNTSTTAGMNFMQIWFTTCFLLLMIVIVESIFCRFPKHKRSRRSSRANSTDSDDTTVSRLARNLSSKESLTYLKNQDSFHNDYHNHISGSSLLVTAVDGVEIKTEIFPNSTNESRDPLQESQHKFFSGQQRAVGRRKRRFGFHGFFMIGFPIFCAGVILVYWFCVAVTVT